MPALGHDINHPSIHLRKITTVGCTGGAMKILGVFMDTLSPLKNNYNFFLKIYISDDIIRYMLLF